MNILEELKLSKKQSNDERYEYLCSQFNAVDYAMKLEKYTIKLQRENKQLKEVIKEAREYINSNPNVFYDEYLIDVETLKNNECIDDTVGEIKFISNLLQILDKAKEN